MSWPSSVGPSRGTGSPGAGRGPSAAEEAGLARLLAAVPDGEIVLLDGLVACGVPDAVVPQAGRVRLVVIVHLPLADEAGLPADVAADLDARERATLRAADAMVVTSAAAARQLAGTAGLGHAGAHRGARHRSRTAGGRHRRGIGAAVRGGGDPGQGSRRARRRARRRRGPAVDLRVRGPARPSARTRRRAAAAHRALRARRARAPGRPARPGRLARRIRRGRPRRAGVADRDLRDGRRRGAGPRGAGDGNDGRRPARHRRPRPRRHPPGLLVPPGRPRPARRPPSVGGSTSPRCAPGCAPRRRARRPRCPAGTATAAALPRTRPGRRGVPCRRAGAAHPDRPAAHPADRAATSPPAGARGRRSGTPPAPAGQPRFAPPRSPRAPRRRRRRAASPPVAEPDWLDLREPADRRARSAELARELAAALRPGPVRILDVGCGSGATTRWLAPLLPGPQEWVLLDRDPALLALVPERTAAARDRDGAAVARTTRLAEITTLTAHDLAAHERRHRFGARRPAHRRRDRRPGRDLRRGAACPRCSPSP